MQIVGAIQHTEEDEIIVSWNTSTKYECKKKKKLENNGGMSGRTILRISKKGRERQVR